MTELDAIEARIFGVMIEKSLTTPSQYPLSLNAITTACNQKSNRNPVVSYSEEQVLDGLERLRSKGLANIVESSGARVLKYRHNGREVLAVETLHLVVLAELLMRGPQTIGDLRTRGSRMRPLESLEATENLVNSLVERDPPFVKRLGPPPGSRAAFFVQLLSPDLHPMATPSEKQMAPEPPSGGLSQRVADLEAEVAELRRQVLDLVHRLGATSSAE